MVPTKIFCALALEMVRLGMGFPDERQETQSLSSTRNLSSAAFLI
jgi:hypothetical protein